MGEVSEECVPLTDDDNDEEVEEEEEREELGDSGVAF